MTAFGAFTRFYMQSTFDMQIALIHSPSMAIGIRPVINSLDIRMDFDRGEITVLLERVAAGDRSAEEALMPRVYVELHRLAMARLNSERPGHTLQATALVHEVYMRLCRAEPVHCENRAHFFRVAARLMRRILVDYARQHKAEKRNHGVPPESLDQAIAISTDNTVAAIEVDELLEKLAELSPRQAQIVELRFYAGLTEEEIASSIGVHVRTVRRDWLVARAWLYSQLRRP